MDAFMGCILPVGFNYPPRDWVFCNGQTMQVQQNAALFALLGTMYGGDGQNTYGIPDLRGRSIFGSQQQGPGLANIAQGEKAGTNTHTVISNGSVTITIGPNNLPQHNHPVTVPGSAFTCSSVLNATTAGGTPPGSYGPTAGAMLGNSTGTGNGVASIYSTTTTPTVALANTSVTTTLVGNASVTSGNTGNGAAITAPVITSANLSNMPPYLGLNYILCTQGIFPSRN